MRLIVVTFLLFCHIVANAFTVTPSTSISLITCGSGFDVYSLYGHTALRVRDSASGIDVAVNYGIFSMAGDDFVYKFVKGETDYMVAASPFDIFLDDYKYEERSVYENVLNLSDSSKQAIVDFIDWNVKAENRVYRYKYFSDNCATRVRDLLEKNAVIRWKTDGNNRKPLTRDVEYSGVVSDYWLHPDSYSFRRLISVYQGKMPWLDFGIHLPMASPADKQIGFREAMFAPDFLMDAVLNAEVQVDGKPVALSQPTVTLVCFPGATPQASITDNPHLVVSAFCLALLLVSLFGFLRRQLFRGIDVFLLFITGIIGLLLFYMSFFSVHEYLFPNYNLVWALPLHAVAAVAVVVSKKFFYGYCSFVLVFYALFFASVAFIPQSISLSYLALPALISLRFLAHLYLVRNGK